MQESGATLYDFVSQDLALAWHKDVILHVVIFSSNPLLTNCNYGIALLLNCLAQ
jgi:hypothetical protein